MDKTAYTKKHWGTKHIYKDPFSDVAVYPESIDQKLKQKAKSIKEKPKPTFKPTIAPTKGPWNDVEPDTTYLSTVIDYLENKKFIKCQLLIGNRLFKMEASPLPADPTWSKQFGGRTIRVAFKEYSVKNDGCVSFETNGFDSPAFNLLSPFYLHSNVYEIPLKNLVAFLNHASTVWPELAKMNPDIIPLAENWTKYYCPSCGKYNPSDKDFPKLCGSCEEKATEEELEEEPKEPEPEEEPEEDYVICDKCGDTVASDDVKVFKGEPYCVTCFKKIATNCTACGDVISKDDAFLPANGEPYCESCFQDAFSYCESCNEFEPSDEVVSVGDHYLCAACAEEYPNCETCGDKVDTKGDDYTTYSGDTYHNSCFNENFMYCSECGEPYPNDEMREVKGDFYCPDCAKKVKAEEAEPITEETEPIKCACGNYVNLPSKIISNLLEYFPVLLSTPGSFLCEMHSGYPSGGDAAELHSCSVCSKYFPTPPGIAAPIKCKICQEKEGKSLAGLLQEKLKNIEGELKEENLIKNAGWFSEITEDWRQESEMRSIRKALHYICKVLKAAKTPLGKAMIRGDEEFKLELFRKLLGEASISFEVPMDDRSYQMAVGLAKKINDLDPAEYETEKGTLNLGKFATAINNFMREVALTYDLPSILNELADFYTKSIADMSPEDIETWGGERKEKSEMRARQLENLANFIESQEQAYDQGEEITDPVQYMEEEPAGHQTEEHGSVLGVGAGWV